MDVLIAYLVVFVAAATPWLEVLLVVPAGIVAGLPPAPTALVAAIGNTATLVPLVLAGDRLRGWWRARRRRTDGEAAPGVHGATHDGVDGGDGVDAGDTPAAGRGGRASRLFDRYGLPGLAALGPLLTGIHVAAVVALAAGADRRRTVVWLTAGVVAWAAITAAATVLGVDAFIDEDRLPDLGLS